MQTSPHGRSRLSYSPERRDGSAWSLLGERAIPGAEAPPDFSAVRRGVASSFGHRVESECQKARPYALPQRRVTHERHTPEQTCLGSTTDARCYSVTSGNAQARSATGSRSARRVTMATLKISGCSFGGCGESFPRFRALRSVSWWQGESAESRWRWTSRQSMGRHHSPGDGGPAWSEPGPMMVRISKTTLSQQDRSCSLRFLLVWRRAPFRLARGQCRLRASASPR